MQTKRFFSTLWALTKPYWVSEKRGVGLILLATVVGLALLGVWLEVQFNTWNREFYNTFESKDEHGHPVRHGQVQGAEVALASILLLLPAGLESEDFQAPLVKLGHPVDGVIGLIEGNPFHVSIGEVRVDVAARVRAVGAHAVSENVRARKIIDHNALRGQVHGFSRELV